MTWVDKPGTCEVCGKPIILKSSRHKWCEECAKEMYKLRSIANREERNRREREYRAGRDPDWWKGKEKECEVRATCYFGTRKHCDYLEITGHSRLIAGFPIRGGRCDAYRPQKRADRRKTPLPKDSGWNIGDLSEV